MCHQLPFKLEVSGAMIADSQAILEVRVGDAGASTVAL